MKAKRQMVILAICIQIILQEFYDIIWNGLNCDNKIDIYIRIMNQDARLEEIRAKNLQHLM
jgi:hypothetical protein